VVMVVVFSEVDVCEREEVNRKETRQNDIYIYMKAGITYIYEKEVCVKSRCV